MIKVAIVYHSEGGRTKKQAEAIRRGAESLEGTEVLFLTTQEASERLEDLDRADAIVFGSPTYLGSMSAEMKRFLESGIDRWFSRAWQNKIAGTFTHSTNFSGDKVNTLIGMLFNAMQQGMIYVSLGQLPASNEPDSMKSLVGPSPDAINRIDGSIGAMATSFEVKADEAPSKGDILTAEAYGRRIADITAQFARGRQ
ncbi:flavodoxin family protein [Alkalihalophilus pseudofirmus]|uniref:flavodoxin family protein n=1 Tax=Alkalihalophilus pseudofirmus TaxID=79885 RepID=UPI00259B59A1|nr:flavodoxin family protein [Alkalihalophilus pseudofirmus]WEG18874.1 flavodoxin family protein [Alkalihalophilus pseudofirmus]